MSITKTTNPGYALPKGSNVEADQKTKDLLKQHKNLSTTNPLQDLAKGKQIRELVPPEPQDKKDK